MSTKRDTFKYRLWWRGSVIYRNITCDLVRREAEHQVRFPGARVQQIGRRTTRVAALKWLHGAEFGKSPVL